MPYNAEFLPYKAEIPVHVRPELEALIDTVCERFEQQRPAEKTAEEVLGTSRELKIRLQPRGIDSTWQKVLRRRILSRR
jgi:hypothetical protein